MVSRWPSASSRFTLAAVTLAAIFAAIYLPGLGHGFVKDDYRWIDAAQVHSAADLGRVFTANVGFYRPLVSTTFAIDHALWGLDPRGYAATNVLLLVADAALLFLLARRFSLPPPAALLATAIWAFNFHGINVAVLWLSGRTSLSMCLFALAATHAFLGDRRLTAGGLALAAMLCKEEAVMLPALLTMLAVFERRGVSRAWPPWAALAVYAALRLHSGAFGPLTAPSYYRFVFAPMALLRNVWQYLDRGATWAAVVSAVVMLGIRARRPLHDHERRAIQLGALWFVAFYAITVFLPIRSSLYAVAPSLGAALIVGALGSRAWDDDPRRFSRIAAALIVVAAVLIPIYRSRNHALVDSAELGTRSLETIQEVIGAHPSPAGAIVAIDEPRSDVTLSDAFGTLFPNAIHLFVGPGWTGLILGADDRGRISDRGALVFELRDGTLRRIAP